MLYYEPQIGGNCRIHVLNAFFQKPVINEESFSQLIQEYDALNLKKYNCNISAEQYDLVNSNQQNIVSYILQKYNIYTRYYPMNSIYESDIEVVEDIIKNNTHSFIFSFNETHIFGFKYHMNSWYQIDSLSGIQKYHIPNIRYLKNHGFIVPYNMTIDFRRNIHLLYDIIKLCTKENIINILLTYDKSQMLLNDIEVPLSICFSILEMQNERNLRQNIYIEKIQFLINLHSVFLYEFNRNYLTNKRFTILPEIIYILLNLAKKF